jgi:hypothetical protein
MSKPLEITKQAISSRQENGICQMIDKILVPDATGTIQTTLEGGVAVRMNIFSGQISVQGPDVPEVTRTYNVGHPQKSGRIAEIIPDPIVVMEEGVEKKKVTLNLNRLAQPFPDGQSRLTIRGGTMQESITLF